MCLNPKMLTKKNAAKSTILRRNFLARAAGLEPATYGLTGVTKNGVKKSAVIGRNLRVSED